MTFHNGETQTDASRVMFINSGDTQNLNADKSITTDYVFVPDESVIVPLHHTILLSLHHTQIPFSFYNFQFGRNTKLDIGLGRKDETAFQHQETIELNEGNYNASTLMTAITTKINGISQVGNLTMKYNRDTLKFGWNYDNNTGDTDYDRLTLRLATGSNADSNFRDEIGFIGNKFVDDNTTVDVWFQDDSVGSQFKCGYSNATTNTTYFTATNDSDFWYGDNDPVNPSDNIFSAVDVNAGVRSIFIRTSLTSTSVLDSSVGGGFSTILARVPIDTDSGGVITISPSDGSVHKLLLKVREITSVEVKLTDQKNRVLDLNGLDWDLSLQFDFIETPEIKTPQDKRLLVEQAQYKRFQEIQKKIKP